jgi:internalin A
MEPLWQNIIEKAWKEGSNILDLGNCALTEIPEMLFEKEGFCSKLTSLNLGSHIMRHQDKDGFSNNTWATNSIKHIHPKIALFTSLTELSFHKNEIEKIEHIDKLVNLKILDFGSNNIKKIENFTTLEKLEVLRISNNNISKIEGLQNQALLQSLYIGWNTIEAIEGLEAMANLESFYIGVNKITSLQNLQQLKKLRLLFADANEIKDCSGIEALDKLEVINLKNNAIEDIYPLLPHIKRGLRVGNRSFEGDIRLEKNPLKNPSVELVSSGNQAIILFFAEAEKNSTTEINETKLLILGAGGVGKTTLAKKLQDPGAALPAPNDTTVGININIKNVPVKVDGRDYLIHIWDFGGQDIYQATHQFFLTRRSLYILMQDGREQKTSLNYWLQAQELLAEDSPVILLQNLKPKGAWKDLDEKTIKANFSNCKDYKEADLSDGLQISPIWNSIKAQLLQMPHFGDKLPIKWVNIRAEIETLSLTQFHISLNTFRDICSKNDIKDTTKQNILLQYLHDLGVVLHFKDIQELKRLIVIKPAWATDAVYKIIDHTKQQNTQGHFSWDDLDKVWNVPKYENMFSQLLALMQKFELCYTLSDKEDTFIAPLLLPESKPDFDWDNTTNLRLNYQYDFMPEGILPRLIVRLHSLITEQAQVWKKGTTLYWNNTKALVTANYIERRIEIKTKGQDPRGLLAIISKELDDINSKFYFTEKRNVRKMVPCICSQCSKNETPYFHSYEVLQKWFFDLKRPNRACDLSGDEVSIQELLNNVSLLPDSLSPNKGATTHKKIFLMLANPVGTEALNLNKEYELIKESHKMVTPGKFTFEFIEALDAKRSNMTRAFAENPMIVHFSGHGEGEDGIVINDEDDTKHNVKNTELYNLFFSKKDILECAVFSACKSETQAELLSKMGIFVVGTKDKIENQTTFRFSQGFYQSVFGGNTYEAAYDSGMYNASGYNSFEAEKFVLYKNGRKIK